ncbi:MAG: trypsin-like peptidase domain-containing protein [Chitinophagaceae bacterium]|nr:trypsin-like peptidase domain-containing protein [Chitinophagaceae bacterium]MCW5905432.1 trypsin-like peptidase domain-containing protein [Chitinophagaceae bacterium]
MKTNFKNLAAIIAISSVTAVLSVIGYGKWMQNKYVGTQEQGKLPVNYAKFFDNEYAPGNSIDFSAAATSATPAVVHIKTKTKARQVANNSPRYRSPFSDMFGGDMFDEFFNGPRIQTIPEQQASGSGVIISQDGYIVTNNHVIDAADEINVTLTNKKTYKATVIGTDPSTDLAVIKIDGSDFPYLVYGNSDDVKLGQWVLAIGYPLNLDVTVSAGIVSAKARSININQRQSKTPVESFIQTDAAVNPGNSGGALINTNGELVGINSAIASPTGYYTGYAYAIPVNIVKKAITDMIKYGSVQRAFLGVSYPGEGLSEKQQEELSKQYGNIWKPNDGVFVLGVTDGGAAKAAGIKEKDIITSINGVAIASGPQMQEQISLYKPGDKVKITYVRNGKVNTTTVTLKNKIGNTDIVTKPTILDKVGGVLENVDANTASTNDIQGGVVVKKIGNKALSKTRVQEGFVITSVNGVDIKNIDELKVALENAKGKARLDGIYPGYEGTYTYPLNLNTDDDE